MGKSISHHFKSLENTTVSVDKAKVLELLRCQNIDPKKISDSGRTPLRLALGNVGSSQNQIIRISDIGLNSEDESEIALVHYAVENKNIKAVEWLKDNGADLSNVAKNGKNSLFGLCYEPSWGEIDDVKQEILFDLLVDGGCDVNVRDNVGLTPLHLACETNSIVVVRKLLANGAEVNCRENQNGKTPLHLAVIREHLEIIKCLLDKGANVNSKDSFGDRPLHVAASSKNAVIVMEMLLRRGALVNARNNEGETSLVVAYRHGNVNGMRELLKNGADVNDKRIIEAVTERYGSCEARFLLENSIKLKAAGLPYPKEHFVFTDDEDYRVSYESCRREIEMLTNTFVDGTTSLYAWLHMSRNRRCIHSHNRNLLTLVCSATLDEQFPRYSIVIRSTYRGTVARRALLQPAKDVWAKFTEIYLPDVCLERVFGYFDDADLIDFVEMVDRDA